MTTHTTGVFVGFPEVSSKPFYGYLYDDDQTEYSKSGLSVFKMRLRSRPDNEGNVKHWDVFRLSPNLACFAWGRDYVFTGEGYYVDKSGNAYGYYRSIDHRYPQIVQALIEAWWIEQDQRKLEGLPVLRSSDVFSFYTTRR